MSSCRSAPGGTAPDITCHQSCPPRRKPCCGKSQLTLLFTIGRVWGNAEPERPQESGRAWGTTWVRSEWRDSLLRDGGESPSGRKRERSSVSGTAGGSQGQRQNQGTHEAVPGLLIRGNPEAEGVHPSLVLIFHFVPLMGGFLRLVLRVFLMGITDLSNPRYCKKETKIDCFPCH